MDLGKAVNLTRETWGARGPGCRFPDAEIPFCRDVFISRDYFVPLCEGSLATAETLHAGHQAISPGFNPSVHLSLRAGGIPKSSLMEGVLGGGEGLSGDISPISSKVGPVLHYGPAQQYLLLREFSYIEQEDRRPSAPAP